MSELKLCILDDVSVSNYEHLVNTTFFLDCDGHFFPDNQWTDFTYPILNTWIERLISCKNSSTAKFDLFFMDGSYKLSVCKKTNDLLDIQCIDFSDSPICRLKFECQYEEFLKSLLATTRQFCKILYKRELHKGVFQSVYNQSLMSANQLQALIQSIEK